MMKAKFLKKKKMAEALRESFQRGLADRVAKRDPNGILKEFHVEYLYWPDINF